MPQFPMGAGLRDRSVTIEQVADSTGGSGFPVETWTTLTTVLARREDASGRERFTEGQLTAPFDARWELPYSADWDPELVSVAKVRRLVHRGRIHDIVHSEIIGRRRGVLVLTLARQG